MTYRRFFNGAEAIRHVVEVLHADTRRGTLVETDAARFGLAEIRILYERADYPLPRRGPSRSGLEVWTGFCRLGPTLSRRTRN